MKLLLTSGGLSTPEIVQSFETLCSKNRSHISVAFINEGQLVEEGDKRWSIKEMHQVQNLVGGPIDLLNVFAFTERQLLTRLQAVDALYVLGGHTDYLMSVFNKTGMTRILPDVLKQTVYVGSSAGAMIMCRRISTEAYKEIYDEGDNYGTSEFMNFTDFAIKPHLDNPEFPKTILENILRVTRNYEGTLYALRDDQAIEVNGNEIRHLGEPIITIKSGELI